MKLIFVFLFIAFSSIKAFKTVPFEELKDLTPEKIDTFFEDFPKNLFDFLNLQQKSISSPLDDVEKCLEQSDISDLKDAIKALLNGFNGNEELIERKELCNSDIIETLYRCYDKVTTTDNHPILNAIKSATFLPFHELCTYDNPKEHFDFVQAIKPFKFFKEETKALERYDEIIGGSQEADSDECLAFIISNAYAEIMEESNKFTPLSKGMFTDAIHLYFTMKAKLHFKSFDDCLEVLKTSD